MRSRDFFQKHPTITLVAFLFAVFIFLDVASRNIVKSYGKYLLNKYDHEQEYRIRSDRYHHDLKPDVSIPRTSWGGFFYSIATNSLGFKDRAPRNISIQPEGERIVFLGDSFTEGIGVEYPDTFVGIIAADYEKKGIEVLNASAASYSPSIYFAKTKYLLENVGLQFDGLVVFIDISDIYDEAVRYELNGDVVVEEPDTIADTFAGFKETVEAEKKQHRSLYQRVEQVLRRDFIVTYRLVKFLHDQFGRRDVLYDYDALNLPGSLWTVDKRAYAIYGEKGLSEGREAMDRLSSLCAKHGVQLTVAVYPVPDQIFHNDLRSIQVEFWSDWAEKNRVAFIDFFPEFVPRPFSEKGVRDMLDLYFIPGDVHWNTSGHKKIADFFLKTFRSKTAGI